MHNTLTREQLDRWIQDLSRRLQPQVANARPGDIMDAISQEVEQVGTSVAARDRDYFNDQIRALGEELGCLGAGKADPAP
ncbi:hypothetical protein [Stenotrophomonas sp.]|uniref:hypothetical protein n=2 Tax=unclassified Stenotrophomonas TaxID=196198 RepID=UPI0028AC698A|nr:hypothetical protein [Stenotrophomonas sp.]